MKRVLSLVCLFCLMLFISRAAAQTSTTGSIAGVITDQSGAVVPGAKVTLRSETTGALTDATTKNSGEYRFDLVAPGNYRLVVDQAGFEKLESHIAVSTAQVLAANLRLTVGALTQTVDVEAVSSNLQAENGNVATAVSQAQIEEVPNSGNNLMYVTRITPGMSTSGGFGVSGSTTLYTVDGMLNNDPYNNLNNSGASNLTLGLDDIQEATVTGNGYSGQFGGLAGAQVSYVSKSGGNRVHGNAEYFWTGRALVANNWFNNHSAVKTPRPFENANEYAAQISGPVLHDKLFFLVDTEGLRAVLPSVSTTVLLPSANLQAITFANLSVRGLNASVPFYTNMFNLYNAAGAAHNAQPGNPFASTASGVSTGCPTSLTAGEIARIGTAPGACTTYYQGAATNFANENLIIARGDVVLGTHDKGFIRFEHDTGSQPTATDQVNPLFNAISVQPEYNGQLNETHNFGMRAINNVILSSSWYGALFGPANLPATLAAFPAELTFSDSSLYTLGDADASFPTGRNVTTIQLQDDVAIFAGNHSIKIGGRGYYIKENDHYFTAGTVPLETASTLGAFIYGGTDPNTGATTQLTQSFVAKPNHPISYYQLGFYGEDDWKASSSLSVTAALRIDHQGNVSCLDNCLTLPLEPFPQLMHNAATPYNQALAFNQRNVLPGLQKLEWQPRVGFAFNPKLMNQSLAVRGGIGIFFDGLPGNIVESIVKNSPVKNTFTPSGDNLAETETSNLYTDAAALNQAFSASITNGGSVASTRASLPTALQPFFSPPALYGPQNNFKIYQIYKWNLEVQKQFGRNTVLSINYLGNHGINKPMTNAGLNAYSTTIAGLPTAPVDSRFGQVNYIESIGRSGYNGLITTFTQHFRGGSIFTVGYTYSKALDTITTGISSTTTSSTATPDIVSALDPYNPTNRWAPADADIRNFVTLNYVYKLPFKNIFYGNWQIAGAAFLYSGLPYTVIDSLDINQISGSKSSGGFYGGSLIANYNYTGEAPCSSPLRGACLQSAQFTNRLSNTPTLSLTNIDSSGPRNGFRGPDYLDTDISLLKTIPLHWEGGAFSFGAQAYNILNHPNFSRPASTNSSSSFGQITSTYNPSGIFSGVGGDDSPRILQIKAKLVF